jgi:hypothetical protein
MTYQDEIVEMAKRAGIRRRTDVFFSEYCDGICFDDLEAFAKLVAEREREACAKVCEDSNTWDLYDPNGFAANLIRARGEA